MSRGEALSLILGYCSIGCWLGAQFPQCIKNYQRRSVDGLALPFLFNWLLGDTSNLIGCILTHQLPFQTYLAIYFCMVDGTLLGQYWMYYRNTPPATISTHRHTHKRGLSSSSTHPTSPLLGDNSSPQYTSPISDVPNLRAITEISNTAANVVAAASALRSQEEGEAGLDEDDQLDAMTASFHSDLTGTGKSRRKHVSWSQDRGGSVGRAERASLRSSLHLTMSRGRPLTRDTSPYRDQVERENELGIDESGMEEVRRTRPISLGRSESAARRTSRASRRSASIVFMGVWALFGIGSFANRQLYPASSPTTLASLNPLSSPSGHVLVHVPTSSSEFAAPSFIPSASDPTQDEPVIIPPPPPEDDTNGPSTERIIGRISAWICTTLYLTSRLPQIWTNYVRKSVEGLSIYLFIFAFLGNFFYVLSIMTSPNLDLPQAEATAFIRESIPYLLGSGGTLMFDVTIVCQAIVYRGRKPRRPSSMHRHHSRNSSTLSHAGYQHPPPHSTTQSYPQYEQTHRSLSRQPSTSRGRRSIGPNGPTHGHARDEERRGLLSESPGPAAR
ncbi:hypothetical protein SISSUDRAFT_1018393 [Sistotremastrum suecicum HHB10207 ss-3]|uniref:PQ-loop-domain-containing protein n=1 Tax=Sistotremastrum suecicum HHB10207 ss-3 TaxID=1314776 RepID=A0A166FR57_9AGAM|nr:hypothetical protein SISSUDRAFT_1018393 [Sistotremastrum suecicum HHB10207 ss-3]